MLGTQLSWESFTLMSDVNNNTMDSILVKAIQRATELLSLSDNNVKEALGKVNAEMNQQRIDIAKHIAPLLTGGVEVDPQDGVDKLLLKLSNQLKDDDVVEFNGASLQLVSSYILNQTIVGVLNKMRAKNSSRVCET